MGGNMAAKPIDFQGVSKGRENSVVPQFEISVWLTARLGAEALQMAQRLIEKFPRLLKVRRTFSGFLHQYRYDGIQGCCHVQKRSAPLRRSVGAVCRARRGGFPSLRFQVRKPYHGRVRTIKA